MSIRKKGNLFSFDIRNLQNKLILKFNSEVLEVWLAATNLFYQQTDKQTNLRVGDPYVDL